jgi:hypothetical protein
MNLIGFEGSCHGMIEELSWNLSERTAEYHHEKLNLKHSVSYPIASVYNATQVLF